MTRTEAHSAWYRTLHPAKRRAILELHRIRPWWNLVALAFVALWLIASLAMVHVPSWYVRLPAYVLIGLVISGMGNFVHEAAHGLLFANKHWNRLLGFVMGVPILFPSTAFAMNHSRHHRHLRTIDDPDELTTLTNNPKLLSFLFYAWLVIGGIVYTARVTYQAIVRGSAEQRRQVMLEQLVILTLVVGVLLTAWFGRWLPTLAHVWLIPLALAMLIVNVRTWAEHMLTRSGHPLHESRTVTSSTLVSLLQINLNYHLEHHLFPGVPWYNLPKVHRILLDDYRAAGSSIYRSYARFMFDAIRLGVHGVT